MNLYTFKLFGADHVFSIILIIIFYVLFLRYHEKFGIKSNSNFFLIVLSSGIIILDLSEDIVRVLTGYYSIKKDGSWTESQNMGPIINTRNNEVSPFYHPRFEVLYFSSNGQLYNFGAFDIYKSYNINNKWSEPINIGPLVNGIGSEFYFTIDASSKNLYYARSSSKDLDKSDLYSFPLPMGARPDAIARLKGSLKDALSGRPFRGIVSVVDMDQGVEVAPKYLKEDGTFEFNLIDKRNYLLVKLVKLRKTYCNFKKPQRYLKHYQKMYERRYLQTLSNQIQTRLRNYNLKCLYLRILCY